MGRPRSRHAPFARTTALNPASPLPLYRQLADVLLARIREGEYPSGIRIPSEPELARTFRIGRPTVRQATDLLVRPSGSRTFSAPRVVSTHTHGTGCVFHPENTVVIFRFNSECRVHPRCCSATNH